MRRRRMPCRSWTSGPCSLPPPSTRPASTSRASRWAWVVGLAVTLALLAWALHDIDPHELVGHLRRADPLLLLAAVALATLTFPLRTLRWQLILRDVGGKRFPLLPLWHATAIGFMANNLLPVRAGEFARAYAAQQQLPVRFSTALASVGVERVLDGLLLVGLMMLAIASPAFPGHAQIGMISVSRITVGGAVCFRAFGLAVPPEGALLLQGIIGFGVALPASPGFLGVFEAATRVTLAIYGIDATRAVSYALAYHVSTFLPITLLGLYSLSRLR